MHSDAGWDTDHTPLSLGLMAHRHRGHGVRGRLPDTSPVLKQRTQSQGRCTSPCLGGSTTNEITYDRPRRQWINPRNTISATRRTCISLRVLLVDPAYFLLAGDAFICSLRGYRPSVLLLGIGLVSCWVGDVSGAWDGWSRASGILGVREQRHGGS